MLFSICIPDKISWGGKSICELINKFKMTNMEICFTFDFSITIFKLLVQAPTEVLNGFDTDFNEVTV